MSGLYRKVHSAVLTGTNVKPCIRSLCEKAAGRGGTGARLDCGLQPWQSAGAQADLLSSARGLHAAAKVGPVVVLAEKGHTPAYGLSALQNVVGALSWLRRTAQAENPQARALAACCVLRRNPANPRFQWLAPVVPALSASASARLALLAQACPMVPVPAVSLDFDRCSSVDCIAKSALEPKAVGRVSNGLGLVDGVVCNLSSMTDSGFKIEVDRAGIAGCMV